MFTHVSGTPDAPFDDVRPLRTGVPDATFGTKQKLAPSDWTPGNVYIDEQDITVPPVTRAPRLTLAVGIGREAVQLTGKEVEGLAGSRLEVLSGLSDGTNRAVIARLATGVSRAKRAIRGASGAVRAIDERGPQGAGRDRPNRPSSPTFAPGRMPPTPAGIRSQGEAMTARLPIALLALTLAFGCSKKRSEEPIPSEERAGSASLSTSSIRRPRSRTSSRR